MCFSLFTYLIVLIIILGQLTMEERIKFNVSRSISRPSVLSMLKREERVKKIKNHLTHFNNVHRNSDLGFLQISPHLTQVCFSLKQVVLIKQYKY